jgi:hypothetical protein
VQHPETGQRLPDSVLLGNLAVLIVGGYDTSAFTTT